MATDKFDAPTRKPGDSSEDKDVLEEAKEAFKIAADAESDNRETAIDDLRFARLSEQWPTNIVQKRKQEGRPCLTIPRMNAFIRQVVNDSRQNRPQIKVHPVDSQADVETAKMLDGLIRNIEYSSNADVAYDTGAECAVTMGWGYWRVGMDHAHDDTFDMDIRIERVSNPLQIYGDPYSTAADSADWNSAFVINMEPKDAFEANYPDAESATANWDDYYGEMKAPWVEEDSVMKAEWWTREEIERKIIELSDGRVVDEDWLNGVDEDTGIPRMLGLQILGITPQRQRMAKSWKVRQRIMTGMEVLESNDWPGRYIPLIPVYGDEVDVEGKRYLRSLIHDAKDAQRMFNYWRHLSLDTPLPTPSGWTTMGDVKVGDQLFDENGEPCHVIGKSPVNIHLDCYRVGFDDGSSIVASDSHAWRVEERSKRTAAGQTWTVRKVTTKELEPGRHFIDVAQPLDGPDVNLPIHPYLLGLWLGDGKTTEPLICPGDEDLDEIRERLVSFGHTLGAVRRSRPADHGVFSVRGVSSEFSKLGLLGNKHLPKEYLRASTEQRWLLLQGFMDSDGSISRANRQCCYTTTNPAISAGFAELLRSLGIKAVSLRREGRHSKLVGAGSVVQQFDQFSFSCYADEPVFGLARKRALQGPATEHRRRTKRHRIVSVEKIPSVPVQCVAIDAPSHLFLAGESMIPTHNTAATELVALAPKTPFVGPLGAFKTAAKKWANINTESWPFIEYDGNVPPQRQEIGGAAAAGALQEALNASDDMKSIMGLYDASLGARSNETSGVAINARKREGDTSTFHFQDNLSRAIRHCGRVIVDLIPHVYSARRVIRTLGEDKTATNVPINQPTPVLGKDGQQQMQPVPGPDGQQQMQPVMRIYNLTTGKYDVTVDAGPSFTTRREEAAFQMTELIRVYPQAAPFIMDVLARNLDWPEADVIAERAKKMLPSQLQEGGSGIPPQVQDMIEQGKQLIGKLSAENASLKTGASLDAAKVRVSEYDAETKRMQVIGDVKEAFAGSLTPDQITALVYQAVQQILSGGPDGGGPPQPPPAPGPGGPPMPGSGMGAGPGPGAPPGMMNGSGPPPMMPPQGGPAPPFPG